MSDLAAALAEFQAAIPRVAKDAAAIVQTKTGGTYGYKYADLASLTQIALPLLAKLGMSFTCCPHLRDDGKFVLRYSLLHTGGERIDGDYPLPTAAVPQAIGSAITYGRRYCLCAVTGIAPDEDDDDAADWPANKDGSLSRSRTTDEQKDAAGVMTSAQQAEHTALRPKASEQPNVIRIRAGDCPTCGVGLPQHGVGCPEAEWYDPGKLPESWQPAEPVTPLSPGTITRDQSARMHAAFNALGVKDRAARIEWTRKTLGLDMLESSSRLSYKQAVDLLAALEARKRAEKVKT